MKRLSLYKFHVVLILSILLSFPVTTLSQSPAPNIKINDSDGPLFFIPSEDNLSISVQLDTKGRTDNADWFLAAETPEGLFFYTIQNWTNEITPALQAALQPVENFHLMDLSVFSLWPGDYTMYFGVDTRMDGEISWEQLYFDYINFTIEDLPYDRWIDASQGGTLSVENQSGDIITLEIPPGSLKESTRITMDALDEPVTSPFENKLFPGIILSPQDIVLKKPARLKVKFATPPVEPEGAAFFHVQDAQRAYPLANRFYRLDELESDLFYFSVSKAATPSTKVRSSLTQEYSADDEKNMAVEAGNPSRDELEEAINVVAEDAKNAANWHDSYASAKTLVEFQALAQSADFYTGLDELALEKSQEIAIKACEAFFEITVPDEDECNMDYVESFFDVSLMLQELGLDGCNDTYTSEKINDIFMNVGTSCDLISDFHGNWNIKLRPRYGECYSPLWTPYDCRDKLGISKVAVECVPSAVEVMEVEIFPTSTGHAIRFPPRTVPSWLVASIGHLPTGQTFPFVIDGQNFSFEYETNTTPACAVYKGYVSGFGAMNIVCSEEGEVTGKISEDGKFLLGTDGQYRWSMEQVNRAVWPIECISEIEPDTRWETYTFQYNSYQEGIFSGAKQ